MGRMTKVFINQIYVPGTPFLPAAARILADAEILSETSTTRLVRLTHDGREIHRKIKRDFPADDSIVK